MLSRDDVIAAALQLADARGLDAVTLRSLAGELGVQAPSLYTHVRSKADLLDALGDRILDEVLAELEPPTTGADWREWMLGTGRRLRAVLLRHGDGARIVSGARSSLRRGDLSELAVTALVGAGVPLPDARLRVLAVERFTVGWVLEEQGPADAERTAPDVDALLARFPNVTAAIREYFEPGRTADDLFDDEIRLILRG
jgi:TetR/AcrR family tetracycline transcriptional repressor